MSQERMKILRMLEEGKITAADASKLLEGLQDASSRPSASQGQGMQSHNFASSSTSTSNTASTMNNRQNTNTRHPEENKAKQQDVKQWGEDLGRKFDTFLKDVEPKLQSFASNVAEKATKTADKMSRSLQEAMKPPATSPVSPNYNTRSTSSYREKHFDETVLSTHAELNLSGFNGTMLVKGYNGDKISAKIIYDPKGSNEPEIMILGDKYILHYDASQYNMVAVEAFVPEFLFDTVFIQQKTGNIVVSNMKVANVELKTGNGRVEVEDVESQRMQVLIDSGEIRMKNVQSKFGKLNNYAGDIHAHNADIEQLEINTTNGNILLSNTFFNFADNYTWIVSASNGQLVTNLPSSPTLGYHIKGRTALGSIQMGLSNMQTVSSSDVQIESMSYRFEEMDRKMKLSLETSNGPLVIN